MLSKFDGKCGRCSRPIAAGSEVKYARHNIWHTSYEACYLPGQAPTYEGSTAVTPGVLNSPEQTPLTKAEAVIQARIDVNRAERKAAKAGAAKPTKAKVAKQAAAIAEELPDVVKAAMLAMTPEQSAVFVRSWMSAQS